MINRGQKAPFLLNTSDIHATTMSEEIKKDLPPKKGPLTKLKESVDDPEEKLEIVSTFVRLGILIWSGAILTLAYIKMPPVLGIPEQKLDPTFIASVFTGTLATFGVQAAKDKKSNNNGLTKEDIEKMIAQKDSSTIK